MAEKEAVRYALQFITVLKLLFRVVMQMVPDTIVVDFLEENSKSYLHYNEPRLTSQQRLGSQEAWRSSVRVINKPFLCGEIKGHPERVRERIYNKDVSKNIFQVKYLWYLERASRS